MSELFPESLFDAPILPVEGAPPMHMRHGSAFDGSQLYDLRSRNPVLVNRQPWLSGLDTPEAAEIAALDWANIAQARRGLQYRMIDGPAPADYDPHSYVEGSVTLYQRVIPYLSTLPLPHVGVWMVDGRQGQGRGLRAVRTVLRHFQSHSPVRTVFLDIQPDNEPSQKLAGKLGAQRTLLKSVDANAGTRNPFDVWRLDITEPL